MTTTTTTAARFEHMTDLELLARYARLVGDAEMAVEHGASERRELELRRERDEVAVAILARMGTEEEQ